jgi:hypothetical protein
MKPTISDERYRAGLESCPKIFPLTIGRVSVRALLTFPTGDDRNVGIKGKIVIGQTPYINDEEFLVLRW